MQKGYKEAHPAADRRIAAHIETRFSNLDRGAASVLASVKLSFSGLEFSLTRSFRWENTVPLVDVTWYEGRSNDQKEELARAICEAFVEIGNARPDTVHVIFRDIDPAQWFKSATLSKEER